MPVSVLLLFVCLCNGTAISTECANGYFGYNCTQRCVEDVCLDTDICNKTNGDCLTGCKHPGYQAPKCTTGGFHLHEVVKRPSSVGNSKNENQQLQVCTARTVG